MLADIDKASDEPIRYAVEAARAAGARLAVPDFGADRAPKETDFNDLHQRKGLEAVRCCIEAASQPAAPGVQLLSASMQVACSKRTALLYTSDEFRAGLRVRAE